ncbi:MAG: hypothetical protein JWQ24_4913 [Tardiphaga sp.]|nr:hypothetical protein [Tardiphaga sp.]
MRNRTRAEFDPDLPVIIEVSKCQMLTFNAVDVIDRPLTPLSYAGVARRTTRRAVGVGVVAGGVYGAAVYGGAVVVAPPVVVAPRCVQAVDPYGRLYTRCY